MVTPPAPSRSTGVLVPTYRSITRCTYLYCSSCSDIFSSRVRIVTNESHCGSLLMMPRIQSPTTLSSADVDAPDNVGASDIAEGASVIGGENEDEGMETVDSEGMGGRVIRPPLLCLAVLRLVSACRLWKVNEDPYCSKGFGFFGGGPDFESLLDAAGVLDSPNEDVRELLHEYAVDGLGAGDSGCLSRGRSWGAENFAFFGDEGPGENEKDDCA